MSLHAFHILFAAVLVAPFLPGTRAEEPSKSKGQAPFAPAKPDSQASPESEPAPLIVPGRSPGPDKPLTPEDRARDWVVKGEAFEHGGALLPAVAAYRNAIAADSKLLGIATRMGDIYSKLGDHDAAARSYAIEVARDPGSLDAGRRLGLALARAGHSDEALQELKLLVRKAPKDGELWSALGFAYVRADSLSAAERAFRRALTLPPETAAEHRDLGAVLVARDRLAAARLSYDLAIKLAPNDAANWLNLGNLERRAKRPEKALAAYRRAEAADSSLALSRQAQAQVLVELGRTREAGAAYRRWLARDPADLAGRLEAFQHFVSEGRADVALEISRDAIRERNDSPDAHLLHGLALDANGRRREALAELRRAQELDERAENQVRIERMIATLRASAPDSLRALFEGDSVRAERMREATRRSKPAPGNGR